MHLFSDTEKRVPVGAYQRLIVALLTDYRRRVESVEVAHEEVPAPSSDDRAPQ
jgi:hypothetical protein